MSAIQQSDFSLFDFRGNDVRVLVDDHEDEWWVASDVCRCLGLSNTSKSVDRLRDDEKTTLTVGYSGQGTPPTTYLLINEKGLYRLIFRSNKAEAEAFQDWVFGEVLPSIRKTGSYTHPEADDTPPLAEHEIRHPDGTVEILRFQQSAGPAGQVDQARPNLRALPKPKVDTETLRERLNSAIKAALHPRLSHKTKAERGGVYHNINVRLKHRAGRGEPREFWKFEDYVRAAQYLESEYDVDVWWIFETGEGTA